MREAVRPYVMFLLQSTRVKWSALWGKTVPEIYFLKILSGVIEPSKGDIAITPGQRLSVLEQDHYKYDDYQVLDTVILGNKRSMRL